MIGRTLSHYKILEEISRGGMAIVYKAPGSDIRRTDAQNTDHLTEATMFVEFRQLRAVFPSSC